MDPENKYSYGRVYIKRGLEAPKLEALGDIKGTRNYKNVLVFHNYFAQLKFTLFKADQALKVMELQEKEAQKA